MKSDLRYSPSDAYETFLFPIFSLKGKTSLDDMATQFHEMQHVIMKTENVGLTDFYKHFHAPENHDGRLEEMRRLQREIDLAVRDAYGWQDIGLDHGFHAVSYLPDNDNIRYTICESARVELLKRLSALNRQCWEEEQKI